MKGGLPRGGGYTIVEVMIFLAVTGVLFAMIVTTFSGQQGRTGFSTGAGELESRMRDVINDISTGYYSSSEGFTCQARSSGPLITGGSAERGTNDQCILIGRVAQFNIAGGANAGPNKYNLYSVVGHRQRFGTQNEVQNFTEAMPRAVVGSGDITERLETPFGIEVRRMYTRNASGGELNQISAVGFFTSFGQYSGGSLQPGQLTVNVVPLGNGTSRAEGDVTTAISNLSASSTINPAGGIGMCLQSASSNQRAFLEIGGGGRQLTTDLRIEEGSC